MVAAGCLAAAPATLVKPASIIAPATMGTPTFMSNFLMNTPSLLGIHSGHPFALSS
jgi:hypothetical protein